MCATCKSPNFCVPHFLGLIFPLVLGKFSHAMLSLKLFLVGIGAVSHSGAWIVQQKMRKRMYESSPRRQKRPVRFFFTKSEVQSIVALPGGGSLFSLCASCHRDPFDRWFGKNTTSTMRVKRPTSSSLLLFNREGKRTPVDTQPKFPTSFSEQCTNQHATKFPTVFPRSQVSSFFRACYLQVLTGKAPISPTTSKSHSGVSRMHLSASSNL